MCVSWVVGQHIAIYDFARHTMTVSNAGIYNNVTKTAEPAYSRTFVQLNMTEAFALPLAPYAS